MPIGIERAFRTAFNPIFIDRYRSIETKYVKKLSALRVSWLLSAQAFASVTVLVVIELIAHTQRICFVKTSLHVFDLPSNKGNSMTDMKVLAGVSAVLLAALTARAADDCSSNYAFGGSLATGVEYNTSEVFATVSPPEAFQRIYASTAKNGFTVEVSNADAGLILASESASRPRLNTASLNVTVKPEVSGSRVIITYVTSGGTKYPDNAVKLRLCKTIEAVSQR